MYRVSQKGQIKKSKLLNMYCMLLEIKLLVPFVCDSGSDLLFYVCHKYSGISCIFYRFKENKEYVYTDQDC